MTLAQQVANLHLAGRIRVLESELRHAKACDAEARRNLAELVNEPPDSSWPDLHAAIRQKLRGK